MTKPADICTITKTQTGKDLVRVFATVGRKSFEITRVRTQITRWSETFVGWDHIEIYSVAKDGSTSFLGYLHNVEGSKKMPSALQYAVGLVRFETTLND